MYCKSCGAKNEDNAYQCTKCGGVLRERNVTPQPQINVPYIPNYLAFSIITTLMCCLPFGIVAIVYSSQVNSKVVCGDIEGAMESSKKAKAWCWWTVIGGAVVAVLYILVFVWLATATAVSSTELRCHEFVPYK